MPTSSIRSLWPSRRFLFSRCLLSAPLCLRPSWLLKFLWALPYKYGIPPRLACVFLSNNIKLAVQSLQSVPPGMFSRLPSAISSTWSQIRPSAWRGIGSPRIDGSLSKSSKVCDPRLSKPFLSGAEKSTRAPIRNYPIS